MTISSYGMHRDADTDLYPPSILMTTVLTNEDAGLQFSEWIEQMPTEQRPTFRALQEEWGRCVSKVYVDVEGAEPEHVGYYFESRQRYEDARRGDREATYIRGAWVTFHDLPALDFLPSTVREAMQGVELLKVGAS